MKMILISVFAALLALILVMVGTIWFVNFVTREYVGRKHRILEEILDSKKVPKTWSARYDKQLKLQEQEGKSKEELSTLKEQAKQEYLKKLDQIILYIQKSNLVDNEETRDIILSDLQEIRQLWENGRNLSTDRASL